MKFLITVALIVFLAYIIIKMIDNNKSNSDNTVHDAWVSTKKASERIGFEKNINSNKRYASNKVEIPDSKKTEKLIDIINDGNKALSDMDRLRNTISDENVKSKISEIYDITINIMKDAIDDPNDIAQIKRFFNYYLPTTIKLLNSYLSLEQKDINSDNITNAKISIEQMLDVAIKAFNKRLDSLFENQTLDIETDIEVMNQKLEQEGLINTNTMKVMEGTK